MLDLSRLGDTIKELLGGGGETAGQSEAAELLGNLNLDPADLAQTGGQDLISLLAEHGVDVAQLDPEQLAGLSERLGLPGGLADVAQILSEEKR